MKRKTIEIKARCNDHDRIRQVLVRQAAQFRGTDHQRDTYFCIPEGRLKLREGNIENALIYYRRENREGPKESQVLLAPFTNGGPLKEILTSIFGTKVIVEKVREIYFVRNVKVHLDRVAGLGTFVEIEAIDEDGRCPAGTLMKQCRMYMDLFGISEEELVKNSYSDLLLEHTSEKS